MSKGLAYTTFAILASSLIFIMAALPVVNPDTGYDSNADRIGEAAFFQETLLSDMERSLEISSRRALSSVINYTVVEGEPLENPEKNVSEALINGTLKDGDIDLEGNASLKEWSSRVSRVAADSGYKLEMEVLNYSFNPEDSDIKSSFRFFSRLKDPTTKAAFNTTYKANTTVSIEGLEDPLLLLRSKGRYVNRYSFCDFSKPAFEEFSGDQNSSSVAQGEAAVQPTDITSVPDASEKILVVEDVDDYSSSNVDDFKGVVSQQPASTPGSYSINYLFDTSSTGGNLGSVLDLKENASIILDNDRLWRAHFREMFKEGCYVKTSEGPKFMDRLENKLKNDGGDGLATLLYVSQLPSELEKVDSAVGYVYFDDSSSDLQSIEGVTGDYSWFRLDQNHVDEWDLNGLVE